MDSDDEDDEMDTATSPVTLEARFEIVFLLILGKFIRLILK